MLQKDYVIEAMRANGGYATFQQLNKLVDYSKANSMFLLLNMYPIKELRKPCSY